MSVTAPWLKIAPPAPRPPPPLLLSPPLARPPWRVRSSSVRSPAGRPLKPPET